MIKEIEGGLVSGEHLEQEARKRKRKKEISLVPKPVEQSEFPGYIVVGENKTKTKIRLAKDIEPWKAFENRIWLLLHKFNFAELNSTKLIVNTPTPSKSEGESGRFEVEVFGRADENVFVIECRTREAIGMKSMHDSLIEFGRFRSRVESAVRRHYQDHEKKIKVSCVIATENVQVNEADQKEARVNGMFIWGERDIEYLEQIAKLHRLIGDAARYQLYAIMFGDQEIRALDVQEPAILGKIGRREYFSFLTTPENLLKISYVHHRASTFEPDSLKQIPVTYQRLLKEKKLQEINKFIEDRYFPNSIIINFDKRPRFEPASRKKSVIKTPFGTLYLPNRYRSAWVIDGQHRLYGYAKSERRFNTKIPVVAIVGLKTSEQAKLFVEINENQTPVEKNLLWDLYSDIYEGTDDPKQVEDLTIANVVKRLNGATGALKGHVYFPSGIKRSTVANITMTTICENIKKNGLLSDKILGVSRLDQRNKEKFIAERLGVFFDVVQDIYAEDWSRGEKGFLRSNNGIAALLIILRQVLKYFNSRDEEEIYLGKNITEFKERLTALLQPVGEYLKSGDELSDNLRKMRGSAGQTESAGILCGEIKKRFDDFRLPPVLPKPLPKDKRQVTEEEVRKQIEDTEKYLRGFVFEKLGEVHGGKWYSEGVPGDENDQTSPKGTIAKHYKERIDAVPYVREDYELSPERKLEFTHLGNLKDMIVAKQNWQIFQETFGSQKSVQKHFSNVIALRDALQHFRTLDRVEWEYGRAAIMWVRKCLKIWIEESQ